MKLMKVLILSLVVVLTVSTLALESLGQRGRRGRGPLTPEQEAAQAARRAASAPDAPRPIDMLDTVWIQEMTWMEVRDALAAGQTTAIIGSGGLEQNGPYSSTGKHNYVLQTTTEAIARKLGNALIAPIVTMEPGNPEREDLTPGSVFVTQETFRAILTDMSTSLKTMGFKNIIMVADSGSNTRGMTEVTAALNAKWKGNPARVFYITEYYTEDRWSYDYLKEIGIHQQPDVQSATRYDIHDDYHYESLIAVVEPALIHPKQRTKAGKFSINGVDMESIEQVIENGKKLAAYRAEITVRAIEKAMAEWKAPR